MDFVGGCPQPRGANALRLGGQHRRFFHRRGASRHDKALFLGFIALGRVGFHPAEKHRRSHHVA